MKIKIDDSAETITLLEPVTLKELRRYIKTTFKNWKLILEYYNVIPESTATISYPWYPCPPPFVTGDPVIPPYTVTCGSSNADFNSSMPDPGQPKTGDIKWRPE